MHRSRSIPDQWTVRDAKQERHEPVGVGEEVKLQGDCGVIGSCLVKERDIVHIEAFA